MNDWREGARCKGYDTDAFFKDARRDEAVELCSQCLVIDECTMYAIDTYSYGTWGGLTTSERNHIRKSRRNPEARNPVELNWG